MDLTTLHVVYAAVLLACAGSLLITWRQNPTEIGPRSWAIGSVLGGVALVIFAVTAGDLSLLWFNACGDLVAWLGMAYYARGTRQFVGLPATPRWVPAIVLVAAPAMFAGLALTPYGTAATIIASSFVFAVLCYDLVWTVMRQPETRRAPSYFIAFFFGLFGTTHAARGIITSADLRRAFYDRPIDHAILFVGILGAAATAMGFAMLTAERLLGERARQVQRLEGAVDDLRRQFEGLAAGDYAVRARRQGTSGPMDVLARLFNETAAQVGVAFDQIEAQRSVLAATLASMLDGLLLVDASGRIVEANPAITALLERDGRPLVGRPLRDLVEAADVDFAVGLIQAVSGGPVRERPVRFRAASGALTLNASVHRDGTGHVQGAVLVVRDDRLLREAQTQLQMNDRLAAMGTVAAGVAHEINNPLAFVISNLDFALEELRDCEPALLDTLDGEIIEALEAARRGGERVRQIVLELKTLSRSDDDSAGHVQVNDLITSAVAMLENEVRHHARLELDLGDLPEVRATEARLGQVFLNLIQNATQAIAPGHVRDNQIRVTSGLTSDGLVFVDVADTGSGIAPAHLQRIFDAFFTTRPVGVGTGLGLAICHRVVSGLGGSIRVQSEPGVGSRFRVLLPVIGEPSPASPVAPIGAAGS